MCHEADGRDFIVEVRRNTCDDHPMRIDVDITVAHLLKFSYQQVQQVPLAIGGGALCCDEGVIAHGVYSRISQKSLKNVFSKSTSHFVAPMPSLFHKHNLWATSKGSEAKKRPSEEGHCHKSTG